MNLIEISKKNYKQFDSLMESLRKSLNIKHIMYKIILPNRTYFQVSTSVDYLEEYLSENYKSFCPYLTFDETPPPPVSMPFLLPGNTDNEVLKSYRELSNRHQIYHPIIFYDSSNGVKEVCTFTHESNDPYVTNYYFNIIDQLKLL